MKLIAVSKEKITADEHEAVNALFEAGLPVLHLRKPACTEEELSSLLLQIPEKYHSRIVLHDCFQLADVFNTGGIHLNRRNPLPVNRPGLRVSKSCHSLEEVKNAGNEFDYVFLSPVFDSISKAGYSRAFTAGELESAKRQHIINEKVVALGGITTGNISLVKSFGFGGAAVLGSLWGEESSRVKDIVKRFEMLQKKII